MKTLSGTNFAIAETATEQDCADPEMNDQDIKKIIKEYLRTAGITRDALSNLSTGIGDAKERLARLEGQAVGQFTKVSIWAAVALALLAVVLNFSNTRELGKLDPLQKSVDDVRSDQKELAKDVRENLKQLNEAVAKLSARQAVIDEKGLTNALRSELDSAGQPLARSTSQAIALEALVKHKRIDPAMIRASTAKLATVTALRTDDWAYFVTLANLISSSETDDWKKIVAGKEERSLRPDFCLWPSLTIFVKKWFSFTVFPKTFGNVTRDKAAFLTKISEPCQRPDGISTYPEYAMFEGQGEVQLNLSGVSARNVIFVGVIIAMGDSPTKLENVRFVNCRFTFGRTPAAIPLLQQVLSRESVSTGVNAD